MTAHEFYIFFCSLGAVRFGEEGKEVAAAAAAETSQF